MATPSGTVAAARQAATGYALRASPSAACHALKDLHHFLGHERGPGMKGWGGMHGHYSRLTPEQMKQRQYMMDQYMGMQQMMMDHMMQRQQWMTPPPAPAGK